MRRYINEDVLENIYNEHPNCYGIRFSENVEYDGEYIGQILLGNKVSKKTIGHNSYVKFSKDKIKYRSNEVDGYKLCVVNQYWVKPFINDPKIPIHIKVYKSKLNEATNERIYFYDFEEIEMTYSQYIKRMIMIDFGNYKYKIIFAYENFKQRYGTHHDYYRALNETCKHYLIEHDVLKSTLSRIDNTKKKYKNLWTKEYIKYLEINRDQRLIDKLFEDDINDINVKKADIIQLKRAE